ncbi:mechanosensitive ion channel family protein [Kosmotoga olearia]|jgi:small conductance mechanosensitive channel|uniref:MscS Mechanosensitive ion channel n=2 Tax=Kosmotoga TaxID=651456 RepID=C5CFR3_KOSOT|nr:mechanosensitive ion channel family protein [Kosmotoga olearia]ACR80411.1 MscS Mechanosensitive ion channel [Kosmotoga olearia TBF 19.5.1]MDI3523383.1 small conductance mechanosensitive channel [Kosmotoga sp.]MDK2952881.1 small conductance mechanosensitive channel [Kosmotoga sp.]
MNNWVNVVIKIGLSLAVLGISFYISKTIFKIVSAVSEKRGTPLKAPNTVRLILNIVFFLIAAMIILSLIFEDLVPIITGIGVSGIIVGFALQQPLENLASGLFLLVGRTIKEGDVVKVGDDVGIVEQVNINHTHIRTFDGKKVLIPNKIVWTNPIVHYWPGNIRRMEMTVALPYETDIGLALKLLQEVLDEEEMIVQTGVSNFVVFDGFKSSSIDFRLYFWFERKNYFDVQNAVAERIYSKLKEKGISIPFPQLDVHVKEFPEMTPRG